MFKGSLITDLGYYTLRRKKLILSLTVAALSFAPLSFLFLDNKTEIILFTVLYILAFYFSIQFAKKMQKSKKGTIQMDENKIQVSSNSGKIVDDINLDQVDQIMLKNQYSLPEESTKDILQESNGSQTENYIEVTKNQETKRFDFEISSYYMLNQLNKLVDQWSRSGYRVEYID